MLSIEVGDMYVKVVTAYRNNGRAIIDPTGARRRVDFSACSDMKLLYD